MADITRDVDGPPPFVAPNEFTNNHHPNTNNNHHSGDKPPRPDDRGTPVVSLLAIDQHQEKDYLSMRGGRRRKPAYPNGYPTYRANGPGRPRSRRPSPGRVDDTHHPHTLNNNDYDKHPVGPQVHVTASQSFAPRRSRRSIRRGGPAGVSEIGAGDAPLPNDDVVCKKFETLKL